MTERFHQNSVGHPGCRLLRFFFNLLFSPEEVEALRGPLPSCWEGAGGGASFNPSNVECLRLWDADPTGFEDRCQNMPSTEVWRPRFITAKGLRSAKRAPGWL